MGLLEILGMIWEVIVGLIGGLFVTNSVTFYTPNVTSNNNAKLTGSGNTYTVNKSSTVVSTPFAVKGYKSFVWYTSNASTGDFKSQSPCTKVTDGKKYTGYTLTVSSSNKVARQGMIRAYKNENCSGDYKDYTTAKISYKAETPKGLCTFTSGGVEYSGVCDKSGGTYKNIGTQGFNTKSCNCYAKAYALKMVLNKTTNPNVGTTSEEAKQCWYEAWAGDYYLTNDRTFLQNTSDVFDLARDALKDDGKPVMVLTANSSGKTHYLLVKAIKTDSLGKSNSQLSYSDFWVVDSVGNSSTPNTSEPPVEKNWQKLIDNASGNANNRKLIKGSNSAYEVTEMNK